MRHASIMYVPTGKNTPPDLDGGWIGEDRIKRWHCLPRQEDTSLLRGAHASVPCARQGMRSRVAPPAMTRPAQKTTKDSFPK